MPLRHAIRYDCHCRRHNEMLHFDATLRRHDAFRKPRHAAARPDCRSITLFFDAAIDIFAISRHYSEPLFATSHAADDTPSLMLRHAAYFAAAHGTPAIAAVAYFSLASQHAVRHRLRHYTLRFSPLPPLLPR